MTVDASALASSNANELSSSETADLLLAALNERADHATRTIRTTYREAANWIGVGRSTADRAFTLLARHGRIFLVRKGSGYRYPSQWKVLDTRPITEYPEPPSHAPVARRWQPWAVSTNEAATQDWLDTQDEAGRDSADNAHALATGRPVREESAS